MLFEKIHLEDDEKVIMFVRRHWFFLLTRCFGVIFSASLALVAWTTIAQLSDGVGTTLPFALGYYNLYFLYVYSIWLLFHWMALAYVFTDHHLDVWAITDRRIIAIEQVSFFRRHTGSFRLEKLQDMNIEINGIIATLLHFGTVEAQTASGSEEEFRGNYIPRPRELKAVILQAADERMKMQNNVNQQET